MCRRQELNAKWYEMSEGKPKRGRPASIDKDAAMQVMVELFRSKGFAAVSLDDLSSATGLSRPSLYRAFGNKVSMYIGAIDAFGVQVGKEAMPELFATGSVQTDVSNFLSAMLTIYYRDNEVMPGCLVFATAPSATEEAAIQERLEFSIDQTDAFMRSRFVQAAPNADDRQIQTAVEIASNTLIAFSARAKSGATKSELMQMGARSAQAIAAILGAD